jgi:hypothetical protein
MENTNKLAEFKAKMAAAAALVEADRDSQLEAMLDKRCPGSRRPAADRSANDLAAGIGNRLAGSVPSASVGDLPDGVGFEEGR